MSQNHCTTKASHYIHLSEIERGQIQAMLKLKVKPTAIAAELGRDPSTIYREVKRHSIDQKDTYLRSFKVYYAETAQMLYEKSRMNCGCPYKLVTMPDLINEIEQDYAHCRISISFDERKNRAGICEKHSENPLSSKASAACFRASMELPCSSS